MAHKEFRFLHQTLPFAFVVCAHGLELVERNHKRVYALARPLLIAINLAMGLFFGLFHQQAPISLAHELRNDVSLADGDTVLFLMPCHSTPFFSFVHRKLDLQFLTCEPPSSSSSKSYLDEADAFYENPFAWLNSNEKLVVNAKRIALYQSLFDRLNTSEHLQKFNVCKTFFNSFFPVTSRVDRTLFLLCNKK